MTLAQDIFVKLSFHAKMHQLLNSHSEEALEEKLQQSLNTTIEKIERKELEHAEPELSKLKQVALDLRREFEEMKKEKK